MPYTIQISKLGPVPPDIFTPLDLSNPLVTRTQDNDRIIITIPEGVAFGNFDPGEIVGLNNVPYMMLNLSMKSSRLLTTGTMGLMGPQAPGAAIATRKVQGFPPPIILVANMVMRDHRVAFSSVDPGPFTMIITLEPMRDVGLISAYVEGRP